jgi:hypothetical protein
MASNLEIATRVRNLLSERSPAAVDVTIPHIQALIPTALELWSREVMLDAEKLEHLEKSFTPALVAGVLDLTNYVNGTSGKISLKDLRSQTIYTTINGVRTPFTWVGSQAQLNAGRIPSGQPAIFLDGKKLRTRNTDGSLTSLGTATIEFEVASIPLLATEIPAALLGDFILYLANVATKEKLIS